MTTLFPFSASFVIILFLIFFVQGLSALQYVDLRSSRNLYIIGISLFFPLVLCQWMQKHPSVINTGIEELDSTLTVLLSTTILVGGCLGCLLDNLIPGLCNSNFKIKSSSAQEISEHLFFHLFQGTKEERGLVAWENEMSLEGGDENSNASTSSTFDFPFGMDALRRYFQDNNFITSPTKIISYIFIFYFFSCRWTSYVPFLPTYKVTRKQ